MAKLLQADPVNVFSGALNGRRTFYIYTPEGYDDSTQEYPVLYLLHGKSGSETDWLCRGNAVETIERLTRAHELPPTIVVFPNDGQYQAGTFYVNWYDGSGRFEDYIVHDIVSYVDETYRTSKSPTLRAIAGLSMGGYGAVMTALRHPDLFGIAASLSGALGAPSAEDIPTLAPMVGPIKGPYAESYSVFRLSEQLVHNEQRPAIHMNCGTEDFLLTGNRSFDAHLTTLGYQHEYYEFPGAHTWDYWTRHLVEVCRFVNECFAKAAKVSR